MSVSRKIFHCVVDDTALTTNISEIKKWTSQGAITLIVPLYTLERLHALRSAGSQLGANAREAVRFLDRVTSGKHNISASKVVLQGPMEQFENWEDAERYLLPEFLEAIDNNDLAGARGDSGNSQEETKQASNEEASPKDEPGDLNQMSQMLLNRLNFKKDPDAASVNSGGTRGSPTSPMSVNSNSSPEYSVARLDGSEPRESYVPGDKEEEVRTDYVAPTVPAGIKPLLNAILWRLHAQPESTSTSSSCILVTNDRTNQSWAQKFGITVKTIPQLRTAIIYEEKEFKNHCKYLEKNQTAPAEPKPLMSYEEESDDDVLVFVPRAQGKTRPETAPGRAANNRKSNGSRIASGQPNGNVKAKDATPTEQGAEVSTAPIDPDSFSRNIGPGKQTQKAPDTATPSPKRGAANGPVPRGGGGRRGGGSVGRGGMPRGGGRGRGKLWVP